MQNSWQLLRSHLESSCVSSNSVKDWTTGASNGRESSSIACTILSFWACFAFAGTLLGEPLEHLASAKSHSYPNLDACTLILEWASGNGMHSSSLWSEHYTVSALSKRKQPYRKQPCKRSSERFWPIFHAMAGIFLFWFEKLLSIWQFHTWDMTRDYKYVACLSSAGHSFCRQCWWEFPTHWGKPLFLLALCTGWQDWHLKLAGKYVCLIASAALMSCSFED